MREPFGPAIDVRAAIEHDDGTPFGRIDDGDRRPRDARDRAQAQERDREEGPAIAGRDDRLRPPVTYEVHGDAERRFVALAHGLCGARVHGDGGRGVHDLAAVARARLVEQRPKPSLVADDQHMAQTLASGEDRSGDDLIGGVVSAHRIDGDARTSTVHKYSQSGFGFVVGLSP